MSPLCEFFSKLKLVIVLLNLAMLLCACIVLPTPMAGPYLEQSLLLSAKDMPQGWESLGIAYPDQENARASVQTAFVPEERIDNSINISHQITMYSDQTQAEGAYPQWEAEWFNPSWSQPESLIFKPLSATDRYRLECMNLYINNRPATSCRYIQLHGEYIVKVLVNLDYQTMNFTQFEEVLRRLDARLNEQNAVEGNLSP